jgi:hypothetical protein
VRETDAAQFTDFNTPFDWLRECRSPIGFLIAGGFIMKQELTAADYLHSVKVGSLLGFFAGWVIGVALLLYVDSKELNQWPLVASIPLWNALGWAIYGFIVGGGGLFAHVGRKEAHHAEKAPTEQLTPAA